MKLIEGYTNYFITEDGIVISAKTNRAVKTVSSNSGYEVVCLWNNNKRKQVNVHRIVAKNYIPNPENKKCVNHIDGNKFNNSVSNLEWVTYSENHKHAYKNGLRKSLKKERVKKDKYSKLIVDLQYGIFYSSIVEASKLYQINYKTLANMISGHRKNKTNLYYAF